MNKRIYIFLFLFICLGLNAQVEPKPSESPIQEAISKDSILNTNTLKEIDLDDKPKITDYLIISHQNDTTFVDTTLTIHKEYKFNYLRKDNFGLIPFSNLGQTYNSLTTNFENTRIMPGFGARARHFNYMEIADINYFNVPTPLTELFFKTAFEQGQLADSFFTVNTSPQFNFSIAYKGLRSLGKYQNILTSTANFRFTSNYKSKNNRYHIRGHFVSQDLLNQENGGLQDESVINFESGDPEFRDRSILEVNFENAESTLAGKRFHLEHHYNVISEKDSLAKNQISISHTMSFEDKSFQYDQAASATSVFGSAFKANNLRDRATFEHFFNQIQLNYSNNILGDLQFNVANDNYNYGYDKLVVLNGETITNRLKGDILSLGGVYSKQYKDFFLQGEVGVNVSGDFEGHFLKAQMSFKVNEDISALASLNVSSKAPNFNALLYQSDYLNYNWQNKFANTNNQQIAFQANYKDLININIDLNTIDNYVYFKLDEANVTSQNPNPIKPFQNSETITYLRIKLNNEITFGKFALNNTLLFQNVQDKSNTLNLPEFNTRNTLYFSSHLFKKAMYIQTGFTLNYFTSYYMDGYNPVLAEFHVQTKTEFGDFPRLDYFLNAKIRQTRLYLKAEHFNAAITGFNYYTSPNYPYRDFTVRFGVVWNFFL